MREIVYVGSSVTHAEESYRHFINVFKEGVRMATGAYVIDWVEKDTLVDIPDFFNRNLNNVRNCDVMIAILDKPSTGLGFEINEAMRLGKTILCLHQESSIVSRLIVSAASVGLSLKSYKTIIDAVEIAAEFIAARHLVEATSPSQQTSYPRRSRLSS